MRNKKTVFFVSFVFLVASIAGYKAWHHLYFRYLLCDLQLKLPGVALSCRDDLAYISEAELDALLEQPFTYLGQGSQAQSFSSEDGRFVLKIFHFKYFNPPWIVFSPLWWRWSSAVEDKKKAKYLSWCDNLHKAVQCLPHLSGTKWLHLASGAGPRKLVCVIDRLGRRHQLNLRDLHWTLQQRMAPAHEVIADLLRKGDDQQALDAFYKVRDLVIAEAQVGWIDEDTGYIHNCGFNGDGELLHYDLGRLKPLESDEGVVLMRQLAHLRLRLHKWIDQKGGGRAPQLKTSLDAQFFVNTCEKL